MELAADQELAPDRRAEVDRLLAAAATADGHAPLSEQAAVVLDHGASASAGTGAHGDARWLFAARSPDGTLDGLAVVTRSPAAAVWAVETVVHPDHRQGQVTEGRLLQAVVDHAGQAGGGVVRYWAFCTPPDHDAAVRPFGFVPERSLLQMRVPLPLDPDGRRGDAAIAVRAFRPGLDEAAWLVANNRAFADHPEQGGWDTATITARELAPWFDPDGFLLYEVDGRLAGSCWTKVHTDTDPPMGEIYVISVDPDFAGRGLGRGLTVAGLDHLAGLGLTLGMLYVDAANQAAVGLYRSLGFAVDHTDRAYVLSLPLTAPETASP